MGRKGVMLVGEERAAVQVRGGRQLECCFYLLVGHVVE